MFSVPLPSITPSDLSEQLDYVKIAFIGKSKLLQVMKQCPMLPDEFEALIRSLSITVIQYPCIDLDKAKNDVSISMVWCYFYLFIVFYLSVFTHSSSVNYKCS